MNENLIYAAIAGDMAGSTIETRFPKKVDFYELLNKGRFTDDSVLTFAVLETIKKGTDLFESFKDWSSQYQYAGFSTGFRENFIHNENAKPYIGHSTMNGGLMCLSPAIAFSNKEVLKNAVNMTHNVSEVRILAADMYLTCHALLANTDFSECVEKSVMRDFIKNTAFSELQKEKHFDMTAFGTLRESYICIKESMDWVNAVEHALLLGGDTDTRASITAVIAACKWKLPEDVVSFVRSHIPITVIELIDA